MGLRRLFSLVALLWAVGAVAQPADYSWNTQSKNSSESMPLGGGDVGLNVWVENNDLLFYIARSGFYDQHNALLKAGRVRLQLEGGDENAPFSQTLRLSKSEMVVRLQGATILLWVDAFRPIIHVEVESEKALSCLVDYESWRYQDRPYRKNEGRQASHKWRKPTDLISTADVITPDNRGVTFYHHNPAETVFDRTVEVEYLTEIKDELWNPLAYRIFGGRLWSEDLRYEKSLDGHYQTTDFRAWRFRSEKPMRRQGFTIALHCDQTEEVEHWERGLQQAVERATTKQAKAHTEAWWQAFWGRSWIEAAGGGEQITRNYTLFRYMWGCNRYGSDPTKFNGGLFTFDPHFVNPDTPFTPDFRNWGGGTMTAQNQRLVYWPMLPAGDFDLMTVQFDFYERMRANAELRSRHYWGHEGASFTEQIELFGLPNYMEYGTKRPEWFDKGVEYNAWLEHCWDTVLEFCQMILETWRYNDANVEQYKPLIESSLQFFDEHYQYLARRRGRNALDGDKRLILYPGSGCETYKMTYNASSTIAGLQRVLDSYIDYKEQTGDTVLSPWRALRARIPEVPMRTVEGREMIAPAEAWERINNSETPQLYPVFPWNYYSMASDRPIDVALNTYLYDDHAVAMRSSKGWKQDNIWAAMLGQTADAVRLTTEKLANGPHRFPAFWGPGFDWTPDHNWGGSGSIGLQQMLMQTDGKRIVLFPSWPAEWDVKFKLHAPYQTTVEAELKDGRVVNLKVWPEERREDVKILLPVK